MKTIALDTIKAMNAGTFSVQDNSPRGVKTVTAEEIKPGDRVAIDNHFCEVVAAPDQEQAEQQDTTADILRKAADIIEARKDRSAWDRGVNDYALELLDNLAELTPEELKNPATVSASLLNGADNWEKYSYHLTTRDLDRLQRGGVVTLQPHAPEEWEREEITRENGEEVTA